MMSKLKDYALLIKLKLSLLVLSSTLIGFWLTSAHPLNLGLFCKLALGAFLMIAGANAANEIIERGPDALMRRTAVRPLPTGRMKPLEAILATCVMLILGFSILVRSVNPLTAGLSLLAFGLYIFAY